MPKRTIKMVMYAIILLGGIFSYSADAATLLDFNESGASGTTWPGWTWYNGPENSGAGGIGCDYYGKPGWRQNGGGFWAGTGDWYVRTCAKDSADYLTNTIAAVDTANRAPSTSTGASMKVYDSGSASNYGPSWWFLWGDNWGNLGLADSTTNRLDFYLKTTPLNDAGTFGDPANLNIIMGTYTCWTGGGTDGSGNCPYESANGHWYHYLISAGGTDMWMHVQMDQHPTHQRNMGSQGGGAEPGNDPTGPSHHYFANFGKGFYLELGSGPPAHQSAATSYWIDEIRTWTQTQAENEDSITSLWVGYYTVSGKWEVGFMDASLGRYNPTGPSDSTKSTFEMRYSTAPITNANYASATPITMDYNGGIPANSFKRANPWKWGVWNQFSLPAGIVNGNNKIYFAVKDVSSMANGDYHDAPTSNIKTIDYSIRPGGGTSDTTPPAAPSGLRRN